MHSLLLAADHVPALQLLHAAEPESATLCVPAMHCAHKPMPTDENLPPSQILQTLVPAVLNLPAGHIRHAADCDSFMLCRPAAQVAHRTEPAAPAALPASQGLHSPDPAPLLRPAEQLAHADAPINGWCLPASHALQYVMPSSFWNLPTSHETQCTLDVCALSDFPYCPVVHKVQLAFNSELQDPPGHPPLQTALVDPVLPPN
jgi:hypothetical protein